MLSKYIMTEANPRFHVSCKIRIGGSLSATKFYPYRIIAPTVLDCKCKTPSSDRDDGDGAVYCLAVPVLT